MSTILRVDSQLSEREDNRVQIEFIFHVGKHTELKKVNAYGTKNGVSYVLNHINTQGVKTEPGRVNYSPSDLSNKIIYNIYRGRSLHECTNHVHRVVLNFTV